MCPAQVLSRLFISKSILSGLQAWLNRICRPSYTKMRHLTPVLGGGPVSSGSPVSSDPGQGAKGSMVELRAAEEAYRVLHPSLACL